MTEKHLNGTVCLPCGLGGRASIVVGREAFMTAPVTQIYANSPRMTVFETENVIYFVKPEDTSVQGNVQEYTGCHRCVRP